MSFGVGVDIGGTFTDVCVIDGDGRLAATAKVRTTVGDPSVAVLDGVRAALAQLPGAARDNVTRVVHATTLITNAIVERRGARVGLLVTQGYLDTLEIARQHRYDMYDLRLERPEPLVERGLRREIVERVLVDGEVYRPIEIEGVRAAARELCSAGVEAIAIVFLHCFANPTHELAAAGAVADIAPELPLSVSSRVSGQMREYERMVTTVANAYVQPLTARYLSRLQMELGQIVPAAGLSIMTSNGGVIGVAAAVDFPVRLVESGPAAGALAAAEDCAKLGREGFLSFDMGGTTAKACLVISAPGAPPRPDITAEIEVGRVYRFTRGSGLPLQVPSVELIEIGAGGGSIARLDKLGRLLVGPESAGAEPGPACYPSVDGRARVDPAPTVTDADVVLGYLDPAAFLGGRMSLDADAARGALARHIGPDALQAAVRVQEAIDEQMALAFRRHCAERGRDPGARPLYAFGGAGPVHACRVAELLGARAVIVPPSAGVGSAVGLLAAPARVDLARTRITTIDRGADWEAIDALYADMAHEARATLASLGGGAGTIVFDRGADLRFAGQAHQMTIELPLDAAEGAAEARSSATVRRFEQEYARVYGRTPPGVGVVALQWRLTAWIRREGAVKQSTDVDSPGAHRRRASRPRRGHAASVSAQPSREAARRPRLAWFDGAMRETPVWRREALPWGSIAGPLLVEEDASTTVVPPAWTLRVLPSGHVEIER